MKKTLSLLLALVMALTFTMTAMAYEGPPAPKIGDYVDITLTLSAPAVYEGQPLTITGGYVEHTPWDGPLDGSLMVFKDTGEDYYRNGPPIGEGALGNPAVWTVSDLPAGKYVAVYQVENWQTSTREAVRFEVVEKPITLNDIYRVLLQILDELRK